MRDDSTDGNGLTFLNLDERSPLYRYCECSNRIRFDLPDADIARANLDTMYLAMRDATLHIPSRDTIDDIRTSQAWMAASMYLMCGLAPQAKEWARFVNLDVEYAWVPCGIDKALAMSTIHAILFITGGQNVLRSCPIGPSTEEIMNLVRRMWFEPTVDRKNVQLFEYSDKHRLMEVVTHPWSDAKTRILGLVYLSVLDVYSADRNPIRMASEGCQEGGLV